MTPPFSSKRRAGTHTLQTHKALLEELYQAHHHTGFIAQDPIQFAHRLRQQGARTESIELVAFLSALFSYGRREAIIATLDNLFNTRMGVDPLVFVLNYSPRRDRRFLSDFVYRFNTANDLNQLFLVLQRVYQTHGSLAQLFVLHQAHKTQQAKYMSQPDFQAQLSRFMDALMPPGKPLSRGITFLLPHPARGGACKRLLMFLRWVARHEDPRRPEQMVDLGLWSPDVLPARALRLPMDTHVLKACKYLGWLPKNSFGKSTSPSWKTVEVMTERLRVLDPLDPIRYDFALFALGQQLTNKHV